MHNSSKLQASPLVPPTLTLFKSQCLSSFSHSFKKFQLKKKKKKLWFLKLPEKKLYCNSFNFVLISSVKQLQN